MCYIISLLIYGAFLAVPIVMAREMLKSGQEKKLEVFSKRLSISSIILASLALWGTLELTDPSHGGYGSGGLGSLEGFVALLICVLSILGLSLIIIGFYAGRQVKRKFVFYISLIGIFYNVAIFIYSFWVFLWDFLIGSLNRLWERIALWIAYL